MKIGFLASHRGTNMQAVLDACTSGTLQAEPAVLVTNNRGSEARKRAQAYGIPAVVLNATTHPDPEKLDLAIRDEMQRHGVELILLAGYMKKLGPAVLTTFRERILNIHPALLPKYGGKGMYGMSVHRAVIDAGEAVTGVTIHLADEEYDQGRILAQTEIPVLPQDIPETLAERVLHREHEFLVETLRLVCKGEIRIGGNS